MSAEFGLITPMVAAIALGLLWVGEALAPLLGRSRARAGERWRMRLRHLTVAGINAAVAAVFAGATLAVTNWAWSNGIGVLHLLRPALGEGQGTPWWVFAGVSLLGLVLLDGWHYLFHVLAHKTPVLWRFHVLHHNADRMEATAAMRFHAAEIVVQCTLSLPVYVLLGVTIYEVLVYQLVLLPVAMFHHADLRLPAWLERSMRVVIVTPGMHLVHHSKWERETDSNYAAVLSIWDRLFGTYRWRRDVTSIDIGIDGYTPEQTGTLKGMLTTGLTQPEHAPGERPAARDLPRDLRRRDRMKHLRKKRRSSRRRAAERG